MVSEGNLMLNYGKYYKLKTVITFIKEMVTINISRLFSFSLGILNIILLDLFCRYSVINVTNKTNKQNKLRGFSSQANYTYRATAACRRISVPTLADKGCRVVSATKLHGVNFGFLYRSCYFPFK
jgi:hypothetical protein